MTRACRLGAMLIVAAAMTACASTGASPRPFPTPGGAPANRRPPAPPPPGTVPPEEEAPSMPTPLPPIRGGGDGYAIAGAALSFRGVPYRNGGSDPTGFDCSGLVQYVFAQYGVTMPREVRKIYREGKSIDRDELEPGDLVFFSTVAPGASHVGISLGAGQFVHAPSSTGVVRVESIGDQYWSRRYIGARRVN